MYNSKICNKLCNAVYKQTEPRLYALFRVSVEGNKSHIIQYSSSLKKKSSLLG